ncbi:hypothetical protein BU24DRAFT_421608 [Aaosphaeria arxii CBS 175.79]|uniref:RING-type domain-containing protein n=1 Tax=Aaosphaeria arxii CBS 175.79 TaxID=1450172 RepID=A0A6A5XST5_9PLEO|nr:uncharacterized protein BU24DRAFT_421608 [Aaosphaeria arxii CBS 175.79]KAF2015304.1 hypothetical protein BU24DRAFT_421608 [Aaosphaeria arxii CBS 175.79]
MANPAADPKAAALSAELKEFALSLPTTAFPKNFFCALCNQLSFDSWKLLCCNKAICTSCYEKLEFPTTCPSCEHHPLESDLCTVNKSLRNTMRAWLQKAKKKEEAKKAETPAMEVAVPVANSAQAAGSAGVLTENVEEGSKPDLGEAAASEVTGQDTEAVVRAGSVGSQTKENATSLSNDDAQRSASLDAQNLEQSVEPSSAVEDSSAAQNPTDGSGDGSFGNNAMFNGMQGQFGFGFNQNPGDMNGMGWNGGMPPMNGMMGMMGNMNPMDFNNMNSMNMPNMPNGMYGGFGGNMGMPGMNDMSMMNYGGGFGNGWQGGMNGAGFGNMNGYNQMGGYNQSGPQYPQMMNQLPKNNFQNQNRFNAQGATFAQHNRRDSQSSFGKQQGPSTSSRPESQNGLQNRDGESPTVQPGATIDNKKDGEQVEGGSADDQEGNAKVEDTSEVVHSIEAQQDDATNQSSNLGQANGEEMNQSNGLNQIQTVDSDEINTSGFDQSNMMANQMFQQGMMNGFPNNGFDMNGPYNSNMGFQPHNAYGQNDYGHQGSYNPAYGAATVLTGEPRGVGVEGAPTGPRAMREGRPNTGFSSRANNARFNSQTSTPTVQQAPSLPAASPSRQGRGSPERDETLRTKDKSPSRSRSGSRAKDNGDKEAGRDRSRSADRESRRDPRERSQTPTSEDHERRKERRRHRSSRYDDRDGRDEQRDDDYDDRHRDDDRGDRTRSASVDSKHRSRRDKDRHRSSRSHRERSREHRRRHRSRSPIIEERYEEEGHGNGNSMPSELSNRHKSRSERGHRDRSRDRERERDHNKDRRDRRDRDHDRDYEYEKEKDRSRDKDRDRRRSKRDRDDERDREYDDEKYRSSRRSRKDRDRERDRDRDDRDYDAKDSTAARDASPPMNAPTGPSANGFSIRGFSKAKKDKPDSSSKPMPPPTGPRSLQPPKGPAAERRDSRDHKRKSSVSSTPATPTTPTVDDHYAAERERSNRDRVLQTLHGRATGRAESASSKPSSSRQNPSSKRSHDNFDRDHARDEDRDDRDDKGRDSKVPTGPSAHRDKRRKSGEATNSIASLFTAGLRKTAGKRERRGGVKMEGDVERELDRSERERDRRW